MYKGTPEERVYNYLLRGKNVNIDIVLQKNFPGCDYRIIGDCVYENLEWFDDRWPKPTKEFLESEMESLRQVQQGMKYAQDRLPRMPRIESLVVALWEKVVEGKTDQESGITDLQKAREEIKKQFPKG